jgi:hypothetical protein
MYTFRIPSMHATCTANIILPDFNMLKSSGETHKLLISLLCNLRFLLLLHLSQIFSLTICFQTALICVFH